MAAWFQNGSSTRNWRQKFMEQWVFKCVTWKNIVSIQNIKTAIDNESCNVWMSDKDKEGRLYCNFKTGLTFELAKTTDPDEVGFFKQQLIILIFRALHANRTLIEKLNPGMGKSSNWVMGRFCTTQKKLWSSSMEKKSPIRKSFNMTFEIMLASRMSLFCSKVTFWRLESFAKESQECWSNVAWVLNQCSRTVIQLLGSAGNLRN